MKEQRGDLKGIKYRKKINLVQLFGSEPGINKNPYTMMVEEISDIFLSKYDKKFFTLPIPDCFEDLFYADKNMEIACSNTI